MYKIVLVSILLSLQIFAAEKISFKIFSIADFTNPLTIDLSFDGIKCLETKNDKKINLSNEKCSAAIEKFKKINSKFDKKTTFYPENRIPKFYGNKTFALEIEKNKIFVFKNDKNTYCDLFNKTKCEQPNKLHLEIIELMESLF